MFKNRITACMFTKEPKNNFTFEKFESLLEVGYSERNLDWSILRTDYKVLQYTELSGFDWNGTLALWRMFASHFTFYDVEVKYELAAKEMIVDMYNENSSICIIINFNI